MYTRSSCSHGMLYIKLKSKFHRLFNGNVKKKTKKMNISYYISKLLFPLTKNPQNSKCLNTNAKYATAYQVYSRSTKNVTKYYGMLRKIE